MVVVAPIYKSINRLQKGPNIVINDKFSQPYGQCPVRARAYVQSRLSLDIYKYSYQLKEAEHFLGLISGHRPGVDGGNLGTLSLIRPRKLLHGPVKLYLGNF